MGMTAHMKRILVVGGSLGGHHAARCLREFGFDGDLTLIGSEFHRPYDRYPLSKAFLSGTVDETGLGIEPCDLDIDWRLGQTATALDLADRCVIIDGVDRTPFDGLVVATGSRPRVPGSLRRLAGGVFVLRTLEDGMALRAALGTARRRLVIAGGGLIGAEVASVAAAAGHLTTLVDSSELHTSRTLGSPVAQYLSTLHHQNGVRLLTETRATALDVRAGEVRGVHLDTGRRLDADLVVLATGTQPNIEWLLDSGLAADKGMNCRATLHASGSDVVVGVGDVVNAPHPALGGESVRVEHWASTRHQARLAAANLLIGPYDARPQSELPEFGTTIHGARIRAVGFPSKGDTSDVVWGSIQDGEAVVAVRRRDRLVAAVAINAQDRLSLLDEQWRGERVDAAATDAIPSSEGSRVSGPEVGPSFR